MIAVDSGFLYALIDRRDAWHRRAVARTGTVSEGWVTTWPVLTETCHLFYRSLDVGDAVDMMSDVADGGLQVWDLPPSAFARIPELLRQYASLPMGLADASLVLLAEYLGHGRILSTDERDFGAYRWKRTKPFDNLLAESPG